MCGTLLRWPVSAVVLAVLVMLTVQAYAQDDEGERGSIEVGLRGLFGERSSAKFNEYRDIPKGFFIPRSELSLNDLFGQKNFFFTFQTRDTRENDQAFLVALGAARKYRLDVRWDQTPHVFTTTARSFLVAEEPGVFIAPAPLRTVLQSDPANLRALLDSARPLDMSLRRDRGEARFTYADSPDWILNLRYANEKMEGTRPFGTTTNRFTNITELPEPIDYRTHQVDAGTEYSNRRWVVQTAYSGSIFTNEVSTLVWDNAFRTTDILGGSSRGRLDLYPDNAAHGVNIAAMLKLPRSTRVTASIATGWIRQNDAFLPPTINSAIPTVASPNSTVLPVPSLPAASLNGRKQTLAMNYTLTSKAIRSVPLTLRYRSYDYNNNTPGLIFPDWVMTDAYSYGFARRNAAFGYDRKTLGVDASYVLRKDSSLKVLYEWDRFDREFREVRHSNEHTLGAAIDVSPRDWLLLNASYRHSQRTPHEYSFEEFEHEAFPQGEGVERNAAGAVFAFSLPLMPSTRKFDMAERGRRRAETLLQVTPLDEFSVAVSYGATQDRYQEKGCVWLGYDQCYGLLKDISRNYTVEFTVTPRPDVSAYAEYTREKYDYYQIARQRSPARPIAFGGAPANDTPNNDWDTDRLDRVDTYAAGIELFPSGQVVVNVVYSLSVAKNSVLTKALGDPTLPLRDATVTPFLPTTAQNWPDTSNRWHQMAARVKVPVLSRNLTPKVEYRYERYDRVDFHLVNVQQYFINDPTTIAGIFLGVGADIPRYRAHIVSASLEYRF